MPSTEQTYKTEADWLNARRLRIGASEAATVLGENPWQTPLALHLRKRGEIPDRESTNKTGWGQQLEDVIAMRYFNETERPQVESSPYTIILNPAIPWMHTTLDRIAGGDGEFKQGCGVLEIKNVGWRMASSWDDGPPLYVQIQVQHQLAVTGWSWGSVAARIEDDGRFVWYDVERNDPFIEHLIEENRVFMEAVKTGEPPQAKAGDGEALRLLHPRHVPNKVIELPEEAYQCDIDIRRLNNAMEWRIKALDEYESIMKQMLGDAEKGVFADGSGGYSYKASVTKEHHVNTYTSRTLKRTKYVSRDITRIKK